MRFIKRMVLLAMIWVAGPAEAQLVHPPEFWLGETVNIGGINYVPVHINNVSMLQLRGFQAWDYGKDNMPDLKLTGTLKPLNYLQGSFGHLPGNYGVQTFPSVAFNWGGDTTSVYGKWKLNISWAYDLPYGSPQDCDSYPSFSSGILAYLRFDGVGYAQLTTSDWFGLKGCPTPQGGLNYIFGNASTNPVYVYNPPAPPEGGGGQWEEGLGIQQEVEVRRHRTPRASWGQVKQYYR